MAIDLKQIMARFGNGTLKQLPKVHLWHPQTEGTVDILIDEQCCWYHEGTRIERESLVKLLSSILRKDGDAYVLVTPEEKCHIKVTDVPFLVQAIVTSTADPQLLCAITNTEDVIPLDKSTEWQLRDYQGVKIPYIEVRHGLFAKWGRAAYYQLIEQAISANHDDVTSLVIRSGGRDFLLGLLEDQ